MDSTKDVRQIGSHLAGYKNDRYRQRGVSSYICVNNSDMMRCVCGYFLSILTTI